MSKKMAVLLFAYGGGLAGAGLLLQRLVAGGSRGVLITAVAAGGLSVLWGLAAMAGLKGRAWAVLTVIPAAFALLYQAGEAWTKPAGENIWLVRGMVTAMFLITLAILMYLLHGERTAEFYQNRPVQHDASAPRQKDDSRRHERPSR